MRATKWVSLLVSSCLSLTGCQTAPSNLAGTSGRMASTPQLESAVDARFVQWGRSWSFDRYIPSSTKIQERQSNDKGITYLKGTFQFTRFASRYEIPFAATVDGTKEQLAVVNLCYRDHTSGMNDCLGTERASSGSTQLLGAILLIGVVGAIASMGHDSPSSRETEADHSCKEYRDVRRQPDPWVDRDGKVVVPDPEVVGHECARY